VDSISNWVRQGQSVEECDVRYKECEFVESTWSSYQRRCSARAGAEEWTILVAVFSSYAMLAILEMASVRVLYCSRLFLQDLKGQPRETAWEGGQLLVFVMRQGEGIQGAIRHGPVWTHMHAM
jgi:hypothetical protein